MMQMFVLITCANIPIIRSLFRRLLNIQSSVRPSGSTYPLQTPKRSRQDKYFSIDNSKDISANTNTVAASVDRMYPLTRQDSPRIEGEERERGIVKDTAFTVSYSG